jgi:predicted tellurium resistance membrane protein TerC
MEWIFDPSLMVSLATLTFLEIILGIDNIIFISILVGYLPKNHAKLAWRLGLSLAILTRIGLLSTLSWMASLTKPLFYMGAYGFSGRDLILLLGGLFLLWKASSELLSLVLRPNSTDNSEKDKKVRASFFATLVQIILLDIVFSLDSVITAIGISNHLPTMMVAIILSIIVMLLMAQSLSNFIQNNPPIKILALAFLWIVGAVLMLDGMHLEISKNYLYVALAFSTAIEYLNMLYRKNNPIPKA